MKARQRWIEPALLLAAMAAWVTRYACDFGLHLATPAMWSGWFDQGKYLQSALALSQGDLSAAEHWYPLPYPLLAAPFERLTPGDPFFVLDALLFGGSALGFARVMRWLGLHPVLAVAAFVAASLISDAAAQLWLVPWTTTLSACLLWWLLAGCCALVHGARPSPTSDRAERSLGTGLGIAPRRRPARTEEWKRPLAVGALAALVAITRPADALVATAAVGAALLLSRRLDLRTILGTVIGAVLAATPFLFLHLAIYGPHLSGYVRAGFNQGFALGDLPWKAFVVVVTAKPWFPKSPSLFETLPWLVPGLAGAIVAGWGLPRGRRRVAGLLVAAALPSLVLSLTYTDLQPPGLWRFGNAHYFKWLLPVLAVGLIAWVASFGVWRRWAAMMAATAAVLLLTFIRLEPTPVGDEVPARMLIYRGDSLRQWNEAYFASSVICDSRGTMRNVGDFHQVPDVDSERAVAVKRLFGRQPRRWDSGDRPPYEAGQLPVARYAVRVSVGLPCWLGEAVCRMP